MWRDIDFVERAVSISAKKAETLASPDGRELETLAWSPKTYAVRTIPAPDHTFKAMKQLRAEDDGSPYVFLTLDRLSRIRQQALAGRRRARADVGTT